MMIKVKKDEAFSGVIPTRKPVIVPYECPNCGAIFLMHRDIITIPNPEGPCPNCDKEYYWNNFRISPFKYKMKRWWRDR